MAERICGTSFLEPDVLERLSGDPVEAGSFAVVAAAAREVAAGDPCSGAVADGCHLLENGVGSEEALLRLVEPAALEQ